MTGSLNLTMPGHETIGYRESEEHGRRKLLSPAVLEICAGAGGEAIGLETAGFEHAAAVEIDPAACATLRLNRPRWHVIEDDVRAVNGADYRGVDLLAGGVPCPPFSIAGKQLGADDERDLFPEALRLVEQARPAAVLLENVRGLASERFAFYRRSIFASLDRLGYQVHSQLLNASDYGVPQLRPRYLIVALRRPFGSSFRWPQPLDHTLTVAAAIGDLMAEGGWPGVEAWCQRARSIAPTLVGGSKKHGGPDLGPTRARKQWAALGVDGLGLANEPPASDFPCEGLPRLTLRMVARLQGFPDDWQFAGKKTAVHKQIGNALPPPLAAAAVGAIYAALYGQSAEIPYNEQLRFSV